MNEKTKSLIRHAITAVGFLLTMVGLGKYSGLLDILSVNLDGIFAAISTVAGVVTMVIGFFRNKERLVQVFLLFLFAFTLFSSQVRAKSLFYSPTYAEYYQFRRPDHRASVSSLCADHRVQFLCFRIDNSQEGIANKKLSPNFYYTDFEQLE